MKQAKRQTVAGIGLAAASIVTAVLIWMQLDAALAMPTLFA